MKTISRGSIAWIAANLVAAAIYLAAASQTWIEPELRDIPGSNVGEPIIWMLSAFPVALLFMVLNTGLAIRIWFQRGHHPSHAKTFWVTVPMWLVAFAVDRLHH